MLDNNERNKHPRHTKLCAFRKSISEVSKSNLWEITSFSKNYITSEGAVSHNVFYYQPFPITPYQVRFCGNNYFEQLPIVSTAFNISKESAFTEAGNSVLTSGVFHWLAGNFGLGACLGTLRLHSFRRSSTMVTCDASGEW